MGCYSNSSSVLTEDDLSQSSYAAAGRLAHLLKASPEYQLFMQLSEKIYADLQASALIRRLQMMQSSYFRQDDDQAVSQTLAELHELPIMKEYDAAEQQVKLLFDAVDAIVSQGAGLPFAENAVVMGYG